MAIIAATPRDKLQRLVDLGRKMARYWWLIAVFAVVGGGLSLALAMMKKPSFQSWATLYYSERIQSNLLGPGREEAVQRNIGDKYRELLLARQVLEQVVTDPKTNPFPGQTDLDISIDRLRGAIKLEGRGGSAFRIVYSDGDRDRAKAVTEKLTKLLQEKDESLRNANAQLTVDFATKQKEEAERALNEGVKTLSDFLVKNPEFAQDPNQTQGASIRAIKKNPVVQSGGNSRVAELERYRQRLQARLDAPADAPPIKIAAPRSPDRIAAEAVIADAQREVAGAQRDLDTALAKYTAKHPDAIKAQDRLTRAQAQLRSAQADLPPDVETVVPPASPQAREALQKQVYQLDKQIAALQKSKDAPATTTTDSATDRITKLETEHYELRRVVEESRERVKTLADGVFRAKIDADQKAAETGGRLSVIDPAFRPVRPTGPGKSIFLIGGMAVFLSLGFALAIGMAVIDDRLYRRADLDHLGIAVLGVIPPARASKRKRRRKRAKPAKQPRAETKQPRAETNKPSPRPPTQKEAS